MKRALKFTSFQELKAAEENPADSTVRMRRHEAVERFIREIQVANKREDRQRHRK
ncbi:MAG: hypothetical protein JST83_16700 [Bacteroidetes bacterium]|nr:hypothetical protein [Bacteroidota bacterium]